MASTKKIEFEDLKTGQKFKYYGVLHVKDNWGCAVKLISGRNNWKLDRDTLVTPVKVTIKETK